jgi:hypothetical protein
VTSESLGRTIEYKMKIKHSPLLKSSFFYKLLHSFIRKENEILGDTSFINILKIVIANNLVPSRATEEKISNSLWHL